MKLIIEEVDDCLECPFNIRNQYPIDLMVACVKMDKDDDTMLKWQAQHYDEETGLYNLPPYHPDCPLPDVNPTD